MTRNGLELPPRSSGVCSNCGVHPVRCRCFASPGVMSAWAEWIRSLAVARRERLRWLPPRAS